VLAPRGAVASARGRRCPSDRDAKGSVAPTHGGCSLRSHSRFVVAVRSGWFAGALGAALLLAGCKGSVVGPLSDDTPHMHPSAPAVALDGSGNAMSADSTWQPSTSVALFPVLPIPRTTTVLHRRLANDLGKDAKNEDERKATHDGATTTVRHFRAAFWRPHNQRDDCVQFRSGCSRRDRPFAEHQTQASRVSCVADG